ncbi:MAG: dephospho-CoA kinase [Elusimicrobia bacterium RIFCSPHIGHO2_02_FULL_57_9]|nr:MAG: dephospho-CoA kinase [Elusimicrobia bacterium RIFCSPHIGHO2_02_FULL_57_9]
MIIGLTGGIASGKSLALREFSRCGARALALDDVARLQARRGGPAYHGIIKAFGPAVLDSSGEIDRSRLGRRVFASVSARRKLEKITHPVILREMRKQVCGRGGGPCVVDAPLLFEAGLQKEFDLTLLVAAGCGLQLSRLKRREGLSLVQARRRIAAQMPFSAKEKLADIVLRNKGSRKEFQRRIRQYYRALELIGA